MCFILRSAPIDRFEVARETGKDSVLQKVMSAIDCNWSTPKVKELGPYYSLRDELFIKESPKDGVTYRLLCRGNLIVIPVSLRKKLLSQLHEGHMGTKKMKSMLKAYAFWPGCGSEIDQFVKRCSHCTIHSLQSDKPALEPICNIETEPYKKISIDITGPSETLRGRTLLTIIDYYSRYPEVYVLSRGTTAEIVQCLTESFARFGIPNAIVSDNGSVFVSAEFETFVKSLGVQHIKSSNFHPQSNGCVERLHLTLKSRIKKIAHERKAPLWQIISHVLFEIRSSPNDVTGMTPFERFCGRPMRTKLSLLAESLKSAISSPRNMEKEYANKFQGREVRYKVGDLVYFQKGQGDAFRFEGSILEVLPNHAYRIKTREGYLRIYNQSHLKRRFSCFDAPGEADAHAAYDMVVKPSVPIRHEKDHHSKAVPSLRKLRPRRLDPSIYKD